MVAGTASIVGTVWRDDATGGGILGNGILDETGAGIPAVTINLYWDANGDGDHTDAGDFLYTTTTSDASGNYSFTSLPATSGSARSADAIAATKPDSIYYAYDVTGFTRSRPEELAGRLSCTEQPQTILSGLMVPYLRTGRLEEAADAHRRSYRLMRGKLADHQEK